MVIVIIESFLIALLFGVASSILLSLSLLPFPDIAGAASAMQGLLKMLTTAITLTLLARYKVSTAWHLAIVMISISVGVLIFTLMIKRFTREFY